MAIGDILYIGAAFLFGYMTFVIIRGNFQRKFDDEGNRLDLKKKEENQKKEDSTMSCRMSVLFSCQGMSQISCVLTSKLDLARRRLNFWQW